MATYNRYLNTASTAGGDGTTNGTVGATRAYASAVEAEAAGQALATVSTDVFICLMDGAGGDDTTGVGIAGWTNGVDIQFNQNPAGSPYTISGGVAAGTIRVAEDYVTVDGITIEQTASASNAIVFSCFSGTFTAADNNVILKNSTLFGDSTSGTDYDVQASKANLIFDMFNCVTYSGRRAIDTRSAATANLSFCTFYRLADNLGLVCDSEATVKNCYSGRGAGTAQDFWTGGAAPSGSNNVSSDTTATVDYSSSLISKAASNQFVAPGSDFHLKSGSDCEGAGTPVSGITTDFEGDTRDVTTPDVGYDEFVSAGGSAGLTGTATASIDESDIVTGGKTIILTLTGDTWAAAGTGPIGSTADTQALIDGLDSAQVEATGWNAEVRDKEVTTAVVRTSSTVATITLTASAAYDITAQETITATIPAVVLVTSGSPIVAAPTFTVDFISAGGRIMGSLAGLGGLAGAGGIAGSSGGLAG